MKNNVPAKLIRTATVPISLNVLLKGQLKFLNEYYEVKGVASKGAQLAEVAEREGINTQGINMERGISPFKDLVSLYRLYRYLNKEKPLIVHSITPKAGLLSMVAAMLAGVPIRMHTFTGLIFPSRKGFVQKLLINMDQLLCACATNVYPEGKGVKEDLLRYNITQKPLRVLANGNVNGIDTAYFSPDQIPTTHQQALKKQLNINKSDFVFVFVGRLVKDKGINELVSAYSKLKIQNSKLLLVGPFEKELDPLLPETEAEIENNANILSVGFQADVRPYFAISNCLVFPSYREGFPNVVMQAGAMGLPSIVTDINGCNEIVVEEKNGTIVPPKDAQALQKAMEKIKEDETWRNQLAANSRKMIVERYEQKMVWEALLEEYKLLEKEVSFR